MGTEEIYYRYEETRLSLGMDEYDNMIPGYNLSIDLCEYVVVRHTPKGVWINIGGSLDHTYEKFILHKARKKFAHPTKEVALKSFRARKRAQTRILEGKLKQAEVALYMSTRYGVDEVTHTRQLCI